MFVELNELELLEIVGGCGECYYGERPDPSRGGGHWFFDFTYSTLR